MCQVLFFFRYSYQRICECGAAFISKAPVAYSVKQLKAPWFWLRQFAVVSHRNDMKHPLKHECGRLFGGG